MRPPALAVGLALLLTATRAGADPATDYVLHCRGCHGPGGEGAPGAVPSFRGQIARFLHVDGGREYLVRVPGTAQSELDDARLAALLDWMLREYDPEHLPEDFMPFAADEIGRGRRAPLVHAEETRKALLEAISKPAVRESAAGE